MIVCRCEDIRLADVEAAVEAGALSLETIKQWTRVGMGECQGRTCLALVRDWLAGQGWGVDQLSLPRSRFPVRSVMAADLERVLPDGPALQIPLIEIDLGDGSEK